jgi:hypothetical protein
MPAPAPKSDELWPEEPEPPEESEPDLPELPGSEIHEEEDFGPPPDEESELELPGFESELDMLEPAAAEEPATDEMVGSDLSWAEEQVLEEAEGATAALPPLAPGKVLVGLRELCSLSEPGLYNLVATMDTSAPLSTLYARVERREGRARLHVGGTVAEAMLMEEEGALFVEARLVLASVTRPLRLRIADPQGPEQLRLGLDVLAGAFVVDPAERYLQGA